MLFENCKNDYERKMNEIFKSAKEKQENIAIKFMALYEVYLNLSSEQQKKLSGNFYTILVGCLI